MRFADLVGCNSLHPISMENESLSSASTPKCNPALNSPDFSRHMLELDEDDDLEVFSKDATFTDASSINTSLPTSPGSMINQYRFEEDHDSKDFFITVDDPESHVTAIETFITYRIITKTTRSEFDSSEYEVRRRYQDFLWLKGKLEEAHPTLIIHPLPEKFIMKGMVERFNDDFIETRRKALHKFLNRIADHPILSSNEDFKVFLTAQAWELTSHKKQGPGLLSKMGETVKAVAASVRGIKQRPEEFVTMNDYVESFGQKIGMMDKITQRIIKEQKEYLEEMKECGPVYTLWSASEVELVDILKGMAGCIDNCCKATEEQVVDLSEGLLPVLHEYVLCAETLKLKDEIEQLEDKMEYANKMLKVDWERWRKNMQSDLKLAFLDIAEKNVAYYEKCLAIWETFLTTEKPELVLEKDTEDYSQK
ncbi:sorting nexin-7 isoform X2 [Polypterus senegalus]|uniref:sorting nexin-7 isoform X2 n=1 Tax=Polypterus senegalus TaxID=55291 RepID=UPI00196234D4|nr:sorting nexin-7 isoform X2 [Polypterus senegalus]